MIYKTIRELSDAIQSGEAKPTELTQISLERLRKYGPMLNCVVTITEKRAHQQAKRAETELKKGKNRGPLHGIPWGAKDLIATSGGIPTTWGAYPLRNQQFKEDATIVKKLEEAGSVLVAKLAMIELAGGMGYKQPNASFTGPCATPWSLKHWSGGSSSGSGSAVSAGIVPFAIGSETWGSILSPSNNCGVAGLRPTYGRVSRHGAMALSWTLDKLGPLCLCADDCGLVLEAISGKDPEDPSTAEEKWSYEPEERDFKVGVIKGVLEGKQEAVTENFRQATNVLEKYCTIEEITFPEFPYEAITRAILSGEAAAAFDDFTEKGLAAELTAPEDRYGPYARSQILAKDYLRALRLREKMCKIAEDVMDGYDAVIAPTSGTTAHPIDQPFPVRRPWAHGDIMGAVGNGAGLPSIGVPSGFSEEGLPTGIQFMGRPYDENIILGIAKMYQEKTGWHLRHPEMFQV
ncbi:amidase [Candidatus Bathyarchaeota archaeon]|nr:amidase [Candidatus Bathyarchaeota archaeon]